MVQRGVSLTCVRVGQLVDLGGPSLGLCVSTPCSLSSSDRLAKAFLIAAASKRVRAGAARPLEAEVQISHNLTATAFRE